MICHCDKTMMNYIGKASTAMSTVFTAALSFATNFFTTATIGAIGHLPLLALHTAER